MSKIRFGDNCYAIYESGTPTQGQQQCEEMGGDIVSVDTYGEQLFLVAFIKQAAVDGNIWIGKYDRNTIVSLLRNAKIQFYLSESFVF